MGRLSAVMHSILPRVRLVEPLEALDVDGGRDVAVLGGHGGDAGDHSLDLRCAVRGR